MAAGITLGIFRPTAVYGPGDKELNPLFRTMLRGYLPRFGAVDTRLSFLHVSDLAQAVSQWLMAERTPVYPYELCDGVAGGYNWQRLQEIAAAVSKRPVRTVSIPLPLLILIAGTSTLISRFAGKEPM